AEPDAPEADEPAVSDTPAESDAPSYYVPPTEQPAPTKKRTGLIVGLIIVILLAVVFCITAFTDLIFSEKVQFAAVLNSVGSNVDAGFDKIEAEYFEAKTSIKVNGDSSLIEGAIPDEVIELLESVTYVSKQGKDKMIVTILEGDKTIASILGVEKDDDMYIATDFSDITFLYPLGDVKDADERLDRVLKQLREEFYALLESKELVKGEYDGAFDLGMDVKTITLTLNNEDIKALFRSFASELNKEFKTEIADLGIELDEDTFDYLLDELDPTLTIEITVLYDGAFSFARNSLGVSIVLGDGGKNDIEAIYFSNKKNYAVYGLAHENEQMAFVDNYTIDGDTQTGVINFKTNIPDFDDVPGISLAYTIGESKVDGKLTLIDGLETIAIRGSMTSDSGKVTVVFGLDYDNEEIITVTSELAPCGDFDVNVDTSNAIDLINGDYDENELLDELIADIKALAEEKKNDSVILTMLIESGVLDSDSPKGLTALEQYMLDEYDIEHIESYFLTQDSVAFVADDEDMISVLEYGYDGDVIKESNETLYVYVADYTDTEKGELMDIFYDSFSYTETMDNVEVYVGMTDDEDVVYLSIFLWNLDNPQNVKEFTQLGLIAADEGVTSLSYKLTKETLLDSGYEMVA
ncbi:MAG: hypothetical protein IKY44_06860, partial [Clostridia bacterium]|nr:hypothetical protein [Clostridia bacterium]